MNGEERAAIVRENEHRGALIAQAKSRLRFEQRDWCPRHKPPRLVAGVLTFQGERCLFIPGGRDERVRRDLDEAQSAAADHDGRAEVAGIDMARQHHVRVADFWRRRAAELQSDGGHLIAPWAVVLGPLGLESPDEWQLRAACAKCHLGYSVTIDRRRAVCVTPDDPRC